jgi:general secretion pathway protein G
MSARRQPSRGFTLIELVVTVAIVALLSTVAFPLAEVAVKRSKEQELRLALREIRSALDAYMQAVEEGRVVHPVGQSAYPESLDILVDGVPDASSPDRKKKLYLLRRIPRDPLFTDPATPPGETWGKRSYASSHEAPEPGADVYDVYSLSAGIGLNGIAYRHW